MNRFVCVSTMVACIAVASFAQAGTITWGIVQNVTGDSDVVTTGSLLHAYSGGTGTVNGVTFTNNWVGLNYNGIGYNAQQQGNDVFQGVGYYVHVNNSAYGITSAPFSALSAGYQSILAGAVYADHEETSTYTIGGLTSGQSYLVQIWASDARNISAVWDRYTLLYGTAQLDFNQANAGGSPGQFVVGTFLANAATQNIAVYGNVAPQINALQVRAVSTGVPEIDPAGMGSVLALVTGALGLVERRRLQAKGA